jgi:hypothetical protein
VTTRWTRDGESKYRILNVNSFLFIKGTQIKKYDTWRMLYKVTASGNNGYKVTASGNNGKLQINFILYLIISHAAEW